MRDTSYPDDERARTFEERLAAAVRKHEQRHSLPVPPNLTTTIMAAIRHAASPVPAPFAIPWWKHALVIVGGAAGAAVAALGSWWVIVTQVYPVVQDRLERLEITTSSIGSPVDFLYDLYATTSVTDFVALALVVATIPLLFAFRLSPVDN